MHLILVVSLSLLLTACTPTIHQPISNRDIQPGPGLFSGPSGEFDFTTTEISWSPHPIEEDDDIYRTPLDVPNDLAKS